VNRYISPFFFLAYMGLGWVRVVKEVRVVDIYGVEEVDVVRVGSYGVKIIFKIDDSRLRVNLRGSHVYDLVTKLNKAFQGRLV